MSTVGGSFHFIDSSLIYFFNVCRFLPPWLYLFLDISFSYLAIGFFHTISFFDKFVICDIQKIQHFLGLFLSPATLLKVFIKTKSFLLALSGSFLCRCGCALQIGIICSYFIPFILGIHVYVYVIYVCMYWCLVLLYCELTGYKKLF